MSLAPVMRQRLDASPGLAGGTLALLQHPHRWMRRRVERIELRTSEEYESVVSLDLFLPELWRRPATLDDGRATLVPIGLGPKGQKLARFDLSAEGRPASLLTLEENAILSAAALGVLLRAHGVTTEEDLEGLCGRRDDPDALERLVTDIEESGRPGADRDELIWWASLFDARYVLYAALPAEPDAPVDQRHVRFAQTLQLLREGVPAPLPSATTPALGDLRVTVPIGDLGFGSSYHLDLGVPAETRIVEARLYGPAGDQLDSDGDCDRATLETRGQDVMLAAAGVALLVRPERRAFSREAWPTSLVVLLATVIGLALVVSDEPSPSGLASVLLAPVAAGIALSFRSYSEELARVTLRRQQSFFLLQVAALFATVLVLEGRDALPGDDVPLWLRIAVAAPLVLAAGGGAILQRRYHAASSPT